MGDGGVAPVRVVGRVADKVDASAGARGDG